MQLSLLDVSDLTEVLRKKLNIPNAGFMPMGMPMGMPMQAAAPAGEACIVSCSSKECMSSWKWNSKQLHQQVQLAPWCPEGSRLPAALA